MAQFRTISRDMWDDDWFTSLPRGQQVFWVFLLTNRCTEPSGIYKINWRLGQIYLRQSKKRLTEYKKAFQDAGKVTFWQEWVYVHKFLDLQPRPNSKTWPRIVKEVAEAPKRLQKLWIKHHFDSVPTCYRQPIDSLSIGYSTEIETEMEIEIEKDKRIAPSKRAFSVPAPLQGLKLYEKDRKLCQKWEEWYKNNCELHSFDVLHEVKKAHQWELDNPRKRKKDRCRFLTKWMNTTEADTGKQAGDAKYHAI